MINIAILALLLGGEPPQQCTASSSAPALDHVILVVRDIEAASAGFRSHGFRMKPGRLHANNLLNRHIKFRDGSSLELMTVRGPPRDRMAEDYAELMATGEGGVYVALNASGIDTVKAAAAVLKLENRESTSGPWRFLSFPSASPAAAVFFSAGSALVQDPDSVLNHVPAVTGLAEAWLEGGVELVTLLEKLGATRCGSVQDSAGRTGERMALSRGRLVIVPPVTEARSRVIGVVLKGQQPRGDTVHPHSGLWVRYEYDTDPLSNRR